MDLRLNTWFYCDNIWNTFCFQTIENISMLTNLTSLFIGKNKITKLQGLETLVNLRTLSMQVLQNYSYKHFSVFNDLI